MSTLAVTHGLGLGDLLADLRSAWATWNLRRETRVALTELSERNLEDIGLNRADIDTVIARI